MNNDLQKKGRHNGKKSAKRIKPSLIIPVILIIILAAGAATAKYLIDLGFFKDTMRAKAFYFESDLLDGETHTFPAMGADNTTEVSFLLKNHADELRFSEVDINYTVTVRNMTDNEDVPLTADNSENATGTLNKGSCRNSTVTLKGLQAGKTYLVTASTGNTYKKELTANIAVAAAGEGLHAQLQDHTEFIEVTVWTDRLLSAEISYTLTWPAGLVPDSTCSTVQLPDTYVNGAYGSGTLSVPDVYDYSSYIYRFYKTQLTTTYSVSVNNATNTVTISGPAA